MTSIFISYRRNDNPDAAGRVYDRLKSHFKDANVFFDIDSIPAGVDFRLYIRDFVSRCDVQVVIIGENWLGPNLDGVSRLEDESDFVRIEIETALNRGIPVIPVPVGNARMPSENELPTALKDLIYRNAITVKSGTSFEGHMQRLIRGIEVAINKKSKKNPFWNYVILTVVSSIVFFFIWSMANRAQMDDSVSGKEFSPLMESNENSDTLIVGEPEIIGPTLGNKVPVSYDTTYDVELVVPSNMANSAVFVDDKPAEIIERNLVFIKIRLKKKKSSHHIELKDGSAHCSTDVLIEKNNYRIPLCD